MPDRKEREEDREVDYAELLEREYGQDKAAQKLIPLWRSQGDSDKEIYEFLESWF